MINEIRRKPLEYGALGLKPRQCFQKERVANCVKQSEGRTNPWI